MESTNNVVAMDSTASETASRAKKTMCKISPDYRSMVFNVPASARLPEIHVPIDLSEYINMFESIDTVNVWIPGFPGTEEPCKEVKRSTLFKQSFTQAIKKHLLAVNNTLGADTNQTQSPSKKAEAIINEWTNVRQNWSFFETIVKAVRMGKNAKEIARLTEMLNLEREARLKAEERAIKLQGTIDGMSNDMADERKRNEARFLSQKNEADRKQAELMEQIMQLNNSLMALTAKLTATPEKTAKKK